MSEIYFMQTKISILNYRNVVEINGPDNRDFLNNILTNDITQMANDEVYQTALLTPQGKILFDLLIFNDIQSKAIFLECSQEQIDEVVKKLKLYSIRKDVIINKTDLNVLITNNLKFSNNVKTDNRFFKFKMGRIYLDSKEIKHKSYGKFESELLWYKEEKIRNCVPEGEKEIPSNKIFPFEIGIFNKNGVSFDKGCFIGQEVIARVKYRGKIKKFYSSFEFQTEQYIDFDKNYRTLNLNDVDIGEIMFLEQVENCKAFGFCLIKTKYLKKEKGKLKCFYKEYPLNIFYSQLI